MPEMHRTKYVGVCACGVCALFLCIFQQCHPYPPSTFLCSPTQKLSKYHLSTFLQSSISRPPLPFPGEVGIDGAGSSSCLIAWSFPDQPHPEAIQEHYPKSSHQHKAWYDQKGLVTKNKRCSYHSGNSQDFRSSVLGTGAKDQICFLLYHKPPSKFL